MKQNNIFKHKFDKKDQTSMGENLQYSLKGSVFVAYHGGGHALSNLLFIYASYPLSNAGIG